MYLMNRYIRYAKIYQFCLRSKLNFPEQLFLNLHESYELFQLLEPLVIFIVTLALKKTSCTRPY